MSYRSFVLLWMALLLGVALAIQTGTAASEGYVVYDVQVSYGGNPHSAYVNESVSPSSTQGESILSLAVRWTSANFTYSHVVNSSLAAFPYMPAITNQSYDYRNESYGFSAKVFRVGSSQVTFGGKAYPLSDFAFSVNFTRGNSSGSASGNLSAFPSGLVYSVTLHSKGVAASAALASTSLQLQESPTPPDLQAASVGVGASIAAAAVVLSLGVTGRRKKKSPEAQKPEHWVD
ncbi:MAG TPA: hypothetical protein VEC02_06850 [Nitrososphaerales archaeon]|nr:hypothetical protein [Nitrososphaerales archaeon]